MAELYANIFGQWNRYVGHVKSNIGGIYITPKNTNQEGVVYQHVPKETQQRAMQFLQRVLFNTPNWLIKEDILRRI